MVLFNKLYFTLLFPKSIKFIISGQICSCCFHSCLRLRGGIWLWSESLQVAAAFQSDTYNHVEFRSINRSNAIDRRSPALPAALVAGVLAQTRPTEEQEEKRQRGGQRRGRAEHVCVAAHFASSPGKLRENPPPLFPTTCRCFHVPPVRSASSTRSRLVLFPGGSEEFQALWWNSV